MSFDWPKLLREHHVPFVTEGPNVKRGNIYVRCPFCGDADQSEHMGIGLKGEGWACWRSPAHRGKSRAKLISALLNCSWDEAKRLSGTRDLPSPADSDLLSKVRDALGVVAPKKATTRVIMPREFKPLAKVTPFNEVYWNYLYSRHYNQREARWVAENYRLHYALSGQWAGRVIIPVYDKTSELQTWTGRALSKSAVVRYRTLSREAAGGRTPGECILGLPLLHSHRPRAIVFCEGPFDAMRISTLGHDFGVYGVPFFGLNLTRAQIAQLSWFTGRVFLVLDRGAELQRMRISELLAPFGPRQLALPAGLKDPGELRTVPGREWLAECIM